MSFPGGGGGQGDLRCIRLRLCEATPRQAIYDLPVSAKATPRQAI